MRYREITESPQIVGDTTFKLDDLKFNQEFCKKQLPNVVEVLEHNTDYDIYRTGDGFHGWIFLYDPIKKSAAYVVQYETENWKWLAPTVTQCLIWRSDSSSYAVDVTKKIFFKYLLPKYKTIMSDTQQTKAGNGFWVSRMVRASLDGYNVGIADTRDHTMVWYDSIVDGNFDDWLATQNTRGHAERYKEIRYVISQEQIEHKSKYQQPNHHNW